MLPLVASVLLSAAAQAAAAGFRAGLEQGAISLAGSAGTSALGTKLLGSALLTPASSAVGVAKPIALGGARVLLRYTAASVVLAGIGALFVPEYRKAVLDFHDGALRKIGSRFKALVVRRPEKTDEPVVPRDATHDGTEPTCTSRPV